MHIHRWDRLRRRRPPTPAPRTLALQGTSIPTPLPKYSEHLAELADPTAAKLQHLGERSVDLITGSVV